MCHFFIVQKVSLHKNSPIWINLLMAKDIYICHFIFCIKMEKKRSLRFWILQSHRRDFIKHILLTVLNRVFFIQFQTQLLLMYNVSFFLICIPWCKGYKYSRTKFLCLWVDWFEFEFSSSIHSEIILQNNYNH